MVCSLDAGYAMRDKVKSIYKNMVKGEVEHYTLVYVGKNYNVYSPREYAKKQLEAMIFESYNETAYPTSLKIRHYAGIDWANESNS